MDKTSHRYQLKSGECIQYILKKGSPKRKHIALQIDYTGDVIVKLPAKATNRHALDAIQQKSAWILQNLTKLKNRPKPLNFLYCSGEPHLYLGSWYPLEVVEVQRVVSPFKKRVELTNGKIQIVPASNSTKSVKLLLMKWYQQKLQHILTEQLTLYIGLIPWLDKIQKIFIKKMKQRWGSCTEEGVITINTHLVKAPKACLEYVLLHEITHLKELNHSPNYYSLLTKVIPHWKEMKNQLDHMAPLITSE